MTFMPPANPATCETVIPRGDVLGLSFEIRTAADLCRKSCSVDAALRNKEVFALFDEDLGLINIPVLDDDKIVGMINRDSFMRRMARRFHWELYSEKRCTKMMEEVPLVVEVDTPIRELANRLLNVREPHRISEGFVIVRDGKLLGTGLTSDVLAYWMQPAEYFSGDTIAALSSDNGTLYAMLADATGHGLSAAITVEPGDQIVLFFDGLIEAGNPSGKPFGLDQIKKALMRSGKTPQLDRLRDSLTRFLGTTQPHDDVTVLAVSWG